MTSGMTSGAVIMAPNRVLPRKRRNLTSSIAAMVPMATADQAVWKATRRLIHTASISCRSANSSPYHFSEKPLQTVTSRDSLKE